MTTFFDELVGLEDSTTPYNVKRLWKFRKFQEWTFDVR